MRVLTAKDRMQFDYVPLPAQRFEIMRSGHEVCFWRQFIGRVSPISLGEDTELTLFNEGFQFLFNIGKIAR